MSMIGINDVTFAYEGSADVIFDQVSFQLDTDWKLGFTGRNGRGKTTFFHLLMGHYEYKGRITSSVTFDYFPFEVKNPEMMALEIFAVICPEREDWEIVRELSLLKLSAEVLNRPYETLSQGEQTKILLAALFLKEGNFLLIDEPTNHLDLVGRQMVAAYLNQKKGFILVSHDRNFLDQCTNHTLAINKTNIEVQSGNFSQWWANRQKQDQYESAQNERLKKDIVRLNQSAEQAADWSNQVERSKKGTTSSGSKLDRGYVGHKAAKMMKRSKSLTERRQTAIKEKSELLKNLETNEVLKMDPLKHHHERLVEMTQLTLLYGNRPLFEPLDFSIMQGERIALTGGNGSGKSSILKLLTGQMIRYSGTLLLASQLKISYVSQDTSELKGSLSAYAESCGVEESLLKAILRKLDFERAQFEKELSEYSGGQKKKVLLARSLCEKAHLYIWDEPLNFIDIISRIQIEELLLAYQPTMLFVEHDAQFCKKVATRKILLGCV